MWNGEGLVQVQMGNIAAELTRLCEAHLRVQVCAVHVDLTTRGMHKLANLRYLRLKHAVRRGISNHDASDLIAVLLDLRLQIININRAVGCGRHTRNLKPGKRCGCGIRAVRRKRNKHGITLVIAVSLVVGTNSTQTTVLTGCTGVWLQRHDIVSGDSNQPVGQLLDELMPALSLIGGHQRVNIRKFGPGNRFHFRSRVKFHSARTQRNHRAVQGQILIREVAQVAHHLGLGTVLMEDGVLHVFIGTEQICWNTELGICLGGKFCAKCLYQTLQNPVIMRFTDRNTHAVLVDTANVNTSLKRLGNELICASRCINHHGVKEMLIGNTVSGAFQGCRYTSRVSMQTFGDSTQPLGTVIHSVSTGHNRQQSLGGTDVTGSLLATNVLFAGLQRQTVRRLTGGILRYTDQTARHSAFHTLMHCHVGGMRTAKEERQTETLGIAHGNIGTEFPRRLQQGER